MYDLRCICSSESECERYFAFRWVLSKFSLLWPCECTLKHPSAYVFKFGRKLNMKNTRSQKLKAKMYLDCKSIRDSAVAKVEIAVLVIS